VTITPQHLMGKHKKFSLVVQGQKVKTVSISGKVKYAIYHENQIDFTWNGQPLKIDIKTL